MGWMVLSLPLNNALPGDVLEFFVEMGGFSFPLDDLPAPHPLPTVQEVIAALALPGRRYLFLSVVEDLEDNPLDPGPKGQRGDGQHLGEVHLHAEGATSLEDPLRLGTRVKSVSFGKPDPTAVVAALCDLADIMGPLVVHSPEMDSVLVVRPGQRPKDLESEWVC